MFRRSGIAGIQVGGRHLVNQRFVRDRGSHSVESCLRLIKPFLKGEIKLTVLLLFPLSERALTSSTTPPRSVKKASTTAWEA